MKIRILAMEPEVELLVERLREVLTVVDVSAPYAARGTGSLVRVYVEVRL